VRKLQTIREESHNFLPVRLKYVFTQKNVCKATDFLSLKISFICTNSVLNMEQVARHLMLLGHLFRPSRCVTVF
jgi:hypothetical protein